MGVILSTLRKAGRRVPPVRRLLSERDTLRAEVAALRRPYPPGHYYSPIPRIDEAVAYRERNLPVLDIDLNVAGQLALLDALAAYQEAMPFPDESGGDLRFFFRNDYFTRMDALVLYSLLRHSPPARLIEVGSGFSSCLALDTSERFLGNRIECLFIEPYPDRLRGLLRPDDQPSLIERPVQDVPLEVFDRLDAGDVLFIDSSHVSKSGSDVNHLLFAVLPRLRPGVIVHVHDIFYPFEYPRAWVEEGIAWNEVFLLRAFLQNNPNYEILLFNSYLMTVHRDRVMAALPALRRDSVPEGEAPRGEGSLWLRKR